MTSNPRPPGSTDCVHGGEPSVHAHYAVVSPVVQTATYVFENTAQLVAYMEGNVQRGEYGRYGNPTVELVERKVAQLEGAESATLFASGMNALTTTIVALTRAGSHIVLYDDCYRRTRQFVIQILSRFGVDYTLVKGGDIAALREAIRPETRLVISEAPTNPYLTVIDLPKVAEVCHEKRVKTLIDTTFATPLNLRPLALGIDLVVHSATKYLAGHNDVMAGVVAGNSSLVSLIRDLRGVLGGVCDPHAAYLVSRGMKTLALRVERQNETALSLAKALEEHARVKKVWYPGLPSHPNHEVAKKLMNGFGGVVSFELHGTQETTSQFIDALSIPKNAPSLGGVESLVEQPALMSYFELSEQERAALGIPGTLVRYSVGIEEADDIINDILSALVRS